MTDQEYIDSIPTMTVREWIAEIVEYPEFLTDPYYKDFGRALIRRGQQLLDEMASYDDE